MENLFLLEESTMAHEFHETFKKLANLLKFFSNSEATVCSHYVMHTFHGESTLYGSLNVTWDPCSRQCDNES